MPKKRARFSTVGWAFLSPEQQKALRVEALDEALALVRPFVANAWGGWELLEKLEALKKKGSTHA